ncbi:HMG domain-containing protein 4 isoform X2 [Mustela lutreola]|uniref:HMG domain-containing protein 4 isoform X2 n=1 Tax=Mustela lutreola TaxID=9666 RepID=UPI002797BEC0|nr:HMG domain-containing protein 4 isoform X2 [Mustela lutreola]
MAYDDSVKKEDCFDGDHSSEDTGLAAGRSQREKKRSYKDFLREEEEIAAQDSELYFLGTDTHKKKRKHSSDDYYYGDLSSLESSQKKKKKSSPQSADTAMDLLKAITSPLATGSKPSKKTGEKSSTSSSHSESKKEHHRKKVSGSSGELSLEDGGSHKSKKMKPLYVNTETLTLREPDGLKMKLILSPKEKGSSSVDEEPFQYPSQQATVKKSSKKSARDEQGALLLGHELQSFLKTARKKHKSSSDPRSSPGPEGCGADGSQFPESHSANLDLSGLEPILVESDSSSGGELEAGELVIDDSYREIKKKKKSKKSKKKKDKEKHKERRHSKSKRSSGLAAATVGEVAVAPGPPPSIPHPGAAAPPQPLPSLHTDGHGEKKKKKEEKDRERDRGEKSLRETFQRAMEMRDLELTGAVEAGPKKKNMSAYQVFCKEYRVTIVADHPGIDFGELSKKLAEVWKQLPEKDKLIWKQKAQYLQHKQNKAEATTVKRKASCSEVPVKVKASSAGVLSPQKKSPPTTMLLPASPAKAPETEPIDVAAHLQLLGESLSLIGHRLQETEGMVAVSGSLSVLLDSIICALGPLACLTTQLPELNGCPKQVLSNTLDNIAYIMPGL